MSVAPDLASIIGKYFSDKSTAAVVATAEREGLPWDLWKATRDLGLTAVGISEDAGGSGGSLEDALAVHRATGRYAVPLPIAENYLAGWLSAAAGLSIGQGPATIAPCSAAASLVVRGSRVTGVVPDVSWGSSASVVVMLLDGASVGGNRVALLDPQAATIRRGADYAGQPRDTLAFEDALARIVSVPVRRVELLARAGLVRAAQMAGAMEATLAVTQRYTSERVQFGQPIDTFPAVREHLVVLAQMEAMSTLAVARAMAAAASADGVFESFVTKLVTSENAETAARAAHQAHGAIGMTKEYHLQQYTRRLLSWRAEFGTVSELSMMIGRGAASASSIAHLVTADRPHLDTLNEEF